MRLIDAIPLVQEAQRFRGVFKTDLEKYVADMFIRMLDFAPTIEAETVKHGRWRLNRDGSGTCSNCRRTQLNVWDFDNYDNYCAHCGADMRGPEMEGEG